MNKGLVGKLLGVIEGEQILLESKTSIVIGKVVENAGSSSIKLGVLDSVGRYTERSISLARYNDFKLLPSREPHIAPYLGSIGVC
ncbi:MAG: hypothetical protein WC852_02925 [Candidatus Nanoarchaeia archaeon]|jgi:hypothetical protein